MIHEYIRVTYDSHTSDIRVIYEWHTNDIRVLTSDIPVHTSGIGMAYKYIRVTHEFIGVTCGLHMSDIRVTYRNIRVTYG